MFPLPPSLPHHPLSTMFNQIVVHVSGSPGSGKTTLGEWITKKYGKFIAVKDTDEFIQRGDDEDKRLQNFTEGSKEYMDRLRSIKDRGIHDFVKENPTKHIVFVGLMDHFGLKPFYDMKEANVKFFIDIKNADLLRQYYTRFATLDSTTSRSLWEDVANNRDYILSSEEKMKENDDMWNEHRQHNYRLMSQDEIKNFITEVL